MNKLVRDTIEREVKAAEAAKAAAAAEAAAEAAAAAGTSEEKSASAEPSRDVRSDAQKSIDVIRKIDERLGAYLREVRDALVTLIVGSPPQPPPPKGSKETEDANAKQDRVKAPTGIFQPLLAQIAVELRKDNATAFVDKATIRAHPLVRSFVCDLACLVFEAHYVRHPSTILSRSKDSRSKDATTSETLEELSNDFEVRGGSEHKWRNEKTLREIYSETVQKKIFAPNGLAETVSEIIFAAELELRSVSTMVQLAELDSGNTEFQCSESLADDFVKSMKQDTALQAEQEDSSVVVRNVVPDPFDGFEDAYYKSATLADDVDDVRVVQRDIAIDKKHQFQTKFEHDGLNELQSGAIEKRKRAAADKAAAPDLPLSERLRLAWQKANQLRTLFTNGRFKSWGSALVKFIATMGLSFSGSVPASAWFLAYFSFSLPNIIENASDLLGKTGLTITDVIQVGVVRSHRGSCCRW